jgi:hypothetical protein
MLRISSGGAPKWKYAKMFLMSKFSYLFFSNPAHKTKTRTAKRWETTNNKPPGWSLWLANQNLEHIYCTLLWQSVRFCYAFYQPQQTVQENCPNRHVLTFLDPIWLCKLTYWAPVELLLHLHLSATGNVSCFEISSVLWKLCCLYWNMLTEYRMKSSTIFSCT